MDLDAAYTNIMGKFFTHLRVTHAEWLADINTCKASVSNAICLWMDEVQDQAVALGSNSRVATYNITMDTIWMHSNTLREMAFLVSKGLHDARVVEHAAIIKQELTDGICDAIQKFLQGCVMACTKYMGTQGNLDAWLAQISS